MASNWCADALIRHRVSYWQLAYREDSSDTVTLFFKLTKYEAAPAYYLTGVGVVDARKSFFKASQPASKKA